MGSQAVLDWYAVATTPKGEERAGQWLKRLGLETYVPWHTVAQRRGGRDFETRRRLLPGYVLVGLVPNHEPWREISEGYGVLGVVAFGHVPAVIRPRDMATLMAGTLSGAFDLKRDRKRVVQGDQVKAVDGAFFGFCGQVAETPEDDRVVVLFQLFGRASPVVMTLDALELVG